MSTADLPPPPEPDDEPKIAGDGPAGEVVDDYDARRESQEWALDQLTKGRPAEEVEAELVANGWPADDAAEMAEDARRATRHLRGVVTREDVARQSEASYRQSMRRLPLIAFGGLPAFFIGIGNLMRSLAGMKKLKDVSRHPDDREAGE